MRELKFRAWQDGTMISGLSFGDAVAGPHILMQYTGLKDKNGVEIYEGDLMQIGGYRNYVGWLLDDDQDNGFWMFDKSNEPIHALDTGYQFYEIIGNIYENSELLDS